MQSPPLPRIISDPSGESALDPRMWSWKTCGRNSASADNLEAPPRLPYAVFEYVGLDPRTLDVEDAMFVHRVLRTMHLVDPLTQIWSVVTGFGWQGPSGQSRPAPVALYQMLLDNGRLCVPKAKDAEQRFAEYLRRVAAVDPCMPMQEFWLEQEQLSKRYHYGDYRGAQEGDEGARERFQRAYKRQKYDNDRTEWLNANRQPSDPSERVPPAPDGLAASRLGLGDGEGMPEEAGGMASALEVYYAPRKLSHITWLGTQFVKELRLVDRVYRQMVSWAHLTSLVAYVLQQGPDSEARKRFLGRIAVSGPHARAVLASQKRQLSGATGEEDREYAEDSEIEGDPGR